MSTTYSPPDSVIYQTLAVAEPTVGRRNVLIVGPRFAVQLNDGREMDIQPFVEVIPLRVKEGAAWVALGLQHVVDEASLQLFGKDMLAPVSENILAFVKEGSSKLRISSDLVAIANGYGGPQELNSALDSRSIRVGDIVRAEDGDGVVRLRKVTGLLPVATSTSYTPVDLGTGSWINSASPGAYTGDLDRSFTLEVMAKVSGIFTVRVLDSAGVMPMLERNVAVAAVSELITGMGLNFKLSNDLVAGDKFQVDVVAASLSEDLFDGISLDGTLPPGSDVEVVVFQAYTGEITAAQTEGGVGTPYTLDENSVIIGSVGLTNSVTGTGEEFAFFDGRYGSVFASFRAVVKPEAGSEISSVSLDTVSSLGETHQENYVGSCAFAALTGVADSIAPVPCGVFVLQTNGDSAADFVEALSKIKGVDYYYALVAATRNVEAIDALRTHTMAVSTERRKMWRKLYTGVDSPGEYAVWGVLPRGTKIQATLADGVVTIAAEDEGLKSFSADASVGDFITIGGIAGRLEIIRVISANEVEVDSAHPVTTGGIDVIRAINPRNTVKFLQARAAQLRSRRVAQVWCDRAVDAYGKVIYNMNLAAHEAGARVGSLSQVGRTRGRVSIVSSAPTMYSIFDADDLNDIASAGTYIITQEAPNGNVFVRHQLTTENSKGLLYSEDNITAIVDEYSFAHKDVVNAYIGPRNNTRWALSDLDTELRTLATSFTQVDKKFSKFGPLIVTFLDENGVEGAVTVRQDSVLADHVYTFVRLRVPVAINGIVSYIDVDVSFTVAAAA
jgi:hypothetical protein